jgi:hypothetical protein
MIICKVINNNNLLEEFNSSLKVFRKEEYLVAVGFYDNTTCIGGAYLETEFPNELTIEFYYSSPSIVPALGKAFLEFFKYKKALNAKIFRTNYKSLKMVKSLGFRKVKEDSTFIYVQFNKENWKFNKKYPLE